MSCTHRCCIAGCPRTCVVDHSDPHHLDHFCGEIHMCTEMCQDPGFCLLTSETGRPKNDLALRKKCCRVLLPFSRTHAGGHTCSEQQSCQLGQQGGSETPAHHFCNVSCPGCLSLCRKEFGHDGLHDTKHGVMLNTVFVSNSQHIEMYLKDARQKQRRLTKFFTGQAGNKFTCDSYCAQLGRGHTHFAICEHYANKLLKQATLVPPALAQASNPPTITTPQPAPTPSVPLAPSPASASPAPTSVPDECPFDSEISFMSSGRRHRGTLSREYPQQVDEILHATYWKQIEFEDPTLKLPNLGQAKIDAFSRCRVKCRLQHAPQTPPLDAGHSHACTRYVSHDRLSFMDEDYLERISELAERFPWGSISPSGHHFGCAHSFHHYVLIDCTKNMLQTDFVPSSTMKYLHQRNLFAAPKGTGVEDLGNRLGAATELCLRYLHIRYKLSPSDKMTLLWFNRKTVHVVTQNESVKFYASLPDMLMSSYKADSTRPRYSRVLAKVAELMGAHQEEDKGSDTVPMVLILSCGKMGGAEKRKSFSLSLSAKSAAQPKSSVEIQRILGQYMSATPLSKQLSKIQIVKLGHLGNDAKLKQLMLSSKTKVSVIDENRKVPPELARQNKKASMSVEVRMVLAQLMQSFETERCENYGAQSEGGLLVKYAVKTTTDGIVKSLTHSAQSITLEREKLIKEILETERSYVCSLSKTLELYYYPLTKHWSHILPQKDRTTLFSGLLGIYELHKNLLSQIEARLLRWHSEQKIADIFISVAPMFKIYTHYTSKYESAIQTFGEHREKNSFHNFCELRRKDPYSGAQNLTSFMIMPIQRIPRYTMLLKGVLNHTPQEHPDKKDLQEAMTQMNEVAEYLNEKVRERQRVHKMKMISLIITGVKDLIQPDRFLVKDSRLQFTQPFQADLATCMIFLFTDIMVHTLDISQLRVQRQRGLNQSTVAAMGMEQPQSIADADTEGDIMGILEAIPNNTKYECKYMFPLLQSTITPIAKNETAFKMQYNELTCTYIAPNAQERNDWVSLISKSIQEMKKRKESFRITPTNTPPHDNPYLQ